MMKKLIVLGVFGGMLLSVPVAQAVGSHPMAGCGLAYLLFSNSNNDKGTQILAGTTNNIYGTQTFAITSGTSGCTEDGVLAKNQEVEVFASINLINLSEEMSRGDGEFVVAFATLLGATEETRPMFLSFFKENYEALFPSEETTSIEMLQALKVKLATHPELLG